MSIKQFIEKFWKEHSLTSILWISFLCRMISVIFSKGYGMHDDHFLVIEASKSWADGYNFDNWLPDSKIQGQHPSGHSMFYVGFHYLLFVVLKFIHITDAQQQMFVIRLLHALLSLISVYCGYKITLKLAGEKQARYVGLLLGLYWMMPFLSVRNLVEVVCIAPLIAATWIVVKNQEHNKIMPYILAGLFLGIAFSIRFQTMFFTGGFGLALMFQKKFKEAILTGVIFLIVAATVQGGIDLYNWGYPFAEFREYIRYNIENANSYLTQPWYLYLLTISGILIPPMSLFLLYGYFRSWRKYLLLFLPSFVFLCFHSYFPNKQERFIIPIIPFIITLGFIGWNEFIQNSKFWQQRQSLLRVCMNFFWIVNCLALCIVSLAYSKRNRVESMCYLAHKNDVKNIVIEDSNNSNVVKPPLFYLQKWVTVYGVTSENTPAKFFETYKGLTEENKPNYVVFMQEEHIDSRIAAFKQYFPALSYETTIQPSFVDSFVHWLNPVNKNQTSFIYKIQ